MDERKTILENESGGPRGRPAARRRRHWVFGLAAVAIGLLPLILCEVGLRLFDLGRPGDRPDPFAGFNRNFPLFERRGDVYRTSRAHAPFIALQEFPVQKPRGAFRIFCFGGSTVYGHPYAGETAFPKWLELELAGSDPSRSFQAINCGGISYASYRIAPMVQEVLSYQPDLIIVATGHNEFLENRTYQNLKSRSAAWVWLQGRINRLHVVALARQLFHRGAPPLPVAADGEAVFTPTVNTMLDHQSGYASYRRDAVWHQQVFAEYDDSVHRIVASCRAAHVPLLLVKLGSNLRDCPPFKSEHRADLTAEVEADWQAAFDLAGTLEKAEPDRALQFYLQAAKLDAEHALLNYRIARLLDRIGRRQEALSYYERARDEDICPLRIMTPLVQTLDRISAETRTPLLDAASLLAARSFDRIPGADWYVDHVHPTIGGHQLIGRALAAQMREIGLLPKSAAWPEEKRLATYARHLDSLGARYFVEGERRVGWLEQWARRQRLAAETEPNDPAGYARLAFRRFELAQDDAAAEALREALKRDRNVAELVERYAENLKAEGRAERAAALLQLVK